MFRRVTKGRYTSVARSALAGILLRKLPHHSALAGGPIGRVREGDTIQIMVDTIHLTGSIDLVGHNGEQYGSEKGAEVLGARAMTPGIAPDERLPNDTRLWAALQSASGGTWGGCVYDVDRIVELLEAGKRALGD